MDSTHTYADIFFFIPEELLSVRTIIINTKKLIELFTLPNALMRRFFVRSDFLSLFLRNFSTCCTAIKINIVSA